MIRGTLLILLGLFIDLLQAGMSLMLALLTAVPGTVLGGAAGAGIGASACSWIGSTASGICATIGGFALGFFGSWLNPILAGVTEPVGIALGFAIDICMSLTFGALLITFLIFNRMFYPKYLFGALGEVIPGINNIPFWTALVVLSLLKKKSEETGALAAASGLAMAAMSPTSALGTATGGVMKMKETTMDIAERNKGFENSPSEYIRSEREDQIQRGDWPGAQARAAEEAGDMEEKEIGQKKRQIFNDIRPIRTATAILLALMLAGVSAHMAYAQAVDPIRFITTPEVPGPHQQVTIEAQGVGSFLGDATITWQQNGKVVLSGVGERTLTFTSGNLGATTRIHVVVQSSTQGTIVRDFTFIPTIVQLLWEADTSIPPLYPGKALYTAGSRIKVVALPQVVSKGSSITLNNLSYQWSVNDDPAPAQSGKGRSTITFEGSQLRAAEVVGVDVYLGLALVGQASITIPASDPEVELYTKDPLRGVLYDQALPSSVSLVGKEITLQAEPYYFAQESLRSGAISYTWTLGGAETSGPDSAHGVLTLRQTGSGHGESDLTLSVQNIDSSKFVQAAKTVLHIIFGVSPADTSSFTL